jgi:hypothetical protein
MRAKVSLVCLVLASCHVSLSEEARLQYIGEALITAAREGKAEDLAGSAELPGLVRVSEGLSRSLARLSLEGSCGVRPMTGDAPPPVGDGRATHHLYLECDGTRVLGIRFRYDPDLDKFHVAGSWTP